MSELINNMLIENCRNNDRKAQHMVYKTLYSTSIRVCKRYCSSDEEAMEVLNSGFLKVFTHIGDYSGKGSFEGWVHRIMVNTALDYIRKEKMHLHNVEFADSMDIIDDNDGNDSFPINIDINILYVMIRELPLASRAVFNLYVFEENSHSEIAMKLGISAGTSKWHLSNARKILKEKIQVVLQKV